jgi:hypothetical protein
MAMFGKFAADLAALGTINRIIYHAYGLAAASTARNRAG